ncbi:DNA-binding GntR family transcriptional regulator [Agromyces flavus]|uniref:DNA-binding GntR family transcriptional regulator n=1 Tax=Agromyces flavus TaxID=589382 RepID=A0A1H1WST4_9MICO|nr:GntR family transcriptional regulator [Agromyces flavus]MCP2366248.1 DNA-binding GntR family transcriptional regulator [Agromyces flavus]GGI44294.1 GntR family transcriptional regulator [Agromyces flavus]SDT00318.1 DNA-binding transcriptional regulator, GntR family [Agromyces flavus]
MAIERKNLRSQVRDELLARMRAGQVSPGEGINEVQLAAELGVSRTPLREALIALESEGQITSENGKGFRFVPLSATEFEELAPVMAALESLALELSPRDELRSIGRRLEELSADFQQEVVEHALVVTKDDEWHAIMLSACPNRRLLEVIESTRGAFHRYESLLVPNDVMIERVAAEHAEIARHLAKGDVAAASVALKANWMNGMRRIVENASSAYFSA